MEKVTENSVIANIATSATEVCSAGLKKIGVAFALALIPVGTAVADVMTTTNIGGVDVEIRRAGNGIYPLVIFSHGMGGCPGNTDGIQSKLADAGYIVVAPKHDDCLTGSTTPDVPWTKPENWTDQTNRNRRDDIHAVLDALPSSTYSQYIEGFSNIGCMGHSMGGYTCMGVAGAWSSWTRSEIGPVAALSPWHRPLMAQNRVGDMTNSQTLYQGGTLDNPITPELIQSGGTYAQTSPSKYVQVFDRAGHSAWTDGFLSSRFHDQMAYYLISFFDAYLKNGSVSYLQAKKSRVSTLDFEH
jgi:dienelactone hydrolase